MSTNKLNATQKKLIEIIEKVEANSELLSDAAPFDFACINDYCAGRNDSRAIGIAWKMKNKHYGFYCYTCGQEQVLDKEQFKIVKQKLSKEQAYKNMELEKRKKDQKKKQKAA